MFGQTFSPNDIAVIGLLVVLEGVLSIDNALVLGILARRLPRHLQSRALTYGLIGAFVFRLIAIGTAQYLLKWRIVKLIGGAYLVYIAVKHFFFEKHDDEEQDHVPTEEEKEAALEPEIRKLEYDHPSQAAIKAVSRFWPTVAVIELTDIAFAVDSILAAIALVGAPPQDHPVEALHPKLWVVVTGGMIGVILMRVAAVLFIKLLERFPRFEMAAYLLVIVIGAKLLVDWGFNSEAHPHVVDFHSSSSVAFWVFWVTMALCFCVGFLPGRKKELPVNVR